MPRRMFRTIKRVVRQTKTAIVNTRRKNLARMSRSSRPYDKYFTARTKTDRKRYMKGYQKLRTKGRGDTEAHRIMKKRQERRGLTRRVGLNVALVGGYYGVHKLNQKATKRLQKKFASSATSREFERRRRYGQKTNK